MQMDIFSVRQHVAYTCVLSALYAVSRPSVCHTGGSYKNVWSQTMDYEIFTLH